MVLHLPAHPAAPNLKMVLSWLANAPGLPISCRRTDKQLRLPQQHERDDRRRRTHACTALSALRHALRSYVEGCVPQCIAKCMCTQKK